MTKENKFTLKIVVGFMVISLFVVVGAYIYSRIKG